MCCVIEHVCGLAGCIYVSLCLLDDHTCCTFQSIYNAHPVSMHEKGQMNVCDHTPISAWTLGPAKYSLAINL
jgi:hypothetical protein